MKAVVRIALLLAAALLVVGVVWGLVAWQGADAALNGVGESGGGEGGGQLRGFAGGAGRDSQVLQAEGGEHSGLGRGLGRGGGEEDQASWSGLSELLHNLTVIGAIGAFFILASKGLDLLRRIPDRRRSGTLS
jgi:hypothetical protein